MTKTNLTSLNIASAIRQLIAAIAANITIMFEGDPGVGKTSVTSQVFKTLNADGRFTHMVTLIGSTLDPTDVGGFPVVGADGSFKRVPIHQIKIASEHPTLVVLDEFSCAPKGVEATMLRLLLPDHDGIRWAGDTPLHPDSYVLALSNPPEQAPGGFERSAPTTNRMGIFWFAPDYDEVRSYFNTVLGEGDSEDPTSFAALARDFAATLAAKPDLLQIACPDSALEGAPWASPRGCEAGLRHMAALGPDATHEEQLAALSGSMGAHSAQAYLAIRKLREHLPTVDQIKTDPAGALVPDKPDHQIGALGLLQEVANRDVWAAWVYAARLRPEIAQAASHGLQPRNISRKSKHAKAGIKARTKLMSAIGKVISA